MSNREIKIWVKTRPAAYLKSYTGLKTTEALEIFETAFIEFLALHTDFNTIPDSIKAFNDFQNQSI